ncbi:hypothetical protein [Streptomyces sp. NPDC002676]
MDRNRILNEYSSGDDVETSFLDTIGTRKAAVTGKFSAPGPVVRAGLAALDRDRAYVTPGFGNALGGHLTPRRPRVLVAAMAERITRKVLDQEAVDVSA